MSNYVLYCTVHVCQNKDRVGARRRPRCASWCSCRGRTRARRARAPYCAARRGSSSAGSRRAARRRPPSRTSACSFPSGSTARLPPPDSAAASRPPARAPQHWSKESSLEIFVNNDVFQRERYVNQAKSTHTHTSAMHVYEAQNRERMLELENC